MMVFWNSQWPLLSVNARHPMFRRRILLSGVSGFIKMTEYGFLPTAFSSAVHPHHNRRIRRYPTTGNGMSFLISDMSIRVTFNIEQKFSQYNSFFQIPVDPRNMNETDRSISSCMPARFRRMAFAKARIADLDPQRVHVIHLQVWVVSRSTATSTHGFRPFGDNISNVLQ